MQTPLVMLLVACAVPLVALAPKETVFRIPAGALPIALKAFEQQSGCKVEREGLLLNSLRSPGVSGSLRPEAALAAILKGTGLVAKTDGQGVFRLFRPEITLPAVEVRAKPTREVGKTQYSHEELATLPTARRGVDEVLALQPGVRLANTAGSGMNRGSMGEEVISFHGASPYQNLFQIDGMDASNTLNPGNQNRENSQIGNISGATQGYQVDTALIGELRVFDSMVPVEYGRFNGGVVDARLRRAGDRTRAELEVSTSHSGLSETRIGADHQEDFDQGRSGKTPEWTKRFASLSFETRLGERFGAMLGLSRRNSDIKRLTKQGVASMADRVDNALAKFTLWNGESSVQDLTFKFARRADRNVSWFFVDSEWTNENEGLGLAYDLNHQGRLGRWSAKLGWDRLSDRRVGNRHDTITYRVQSPYSLWSVVGHGTEENHSDTLSTKLRFDLNPFRTGSWEHQAYAGIDAQRVDAAYERMQDSLGYQDYKPTPTSPSQHRSKWLYRKGKADIQYTDAALFVADRIVGDRFTFTPGLRLDRDTFLEVVNVSPRLQATWDIKGDQCTRLNAGVSRYFGTSMLYYAFAEQKDLLKVQQTTSSGAPVVGVPSYKLSRYENLKTPYTYEFALGLQQALGRFDGNLTWVKREGRDQISTRTVAADPTLGLPVGTEYTNEGRSTTDSFGLVILNRQPMGFAGAAWVGRFSVDYLRTRRNQSLILGYTESVSREPIYYNGTLIESGLWPAEDFNVPVKADLHVAGQWNPQGLTWSHHLTWKGRSRKAFNTGNHPDDGYEMYETLPIGSHLIWDTTLAYRPSFHRAVEVRVEVKNLLNRMPLLELTDPSTRFDWNQYGHGREIWFSANYRF